MQNVIVAPKNLCIYYTYDADLFFPFLEQINKQTVINGNSVNVDLTKVKKITAAAAVLFFATVNSCQIITGSEKIIAFKFPSKRDNPEAHSLFFKTGLARALNSGSLEKLEELMDKGSFFQSSINAGKHAAKLVNFFSKSLSLDLNSPQYFHLSAAINEAMLNVTHHAYRDPIDDSKILNIKKTIVDALGERWWIGVMTSESKATLIICDFGQGIQFSYESQLVVEQNYSRAHNLSDEQLHRLKNRDVECLRQAYSSGCSRFKSGGRGNGSEDIKRGVSSNVAEQEALLVYSHNLKYHYAINSHNPVPVIERVRNFFNGTLIEWTINLGTK